MNDPTLPQRRPLSKAVELSRDFFGNLVLYCEKCDHNVTDGSSWCCPWARIMFWNYFYGKIRQEKTDDKDNPAVA
jgi:hypothetical protein